MGACFPQLGYTGMSTFHMGINDALIALCCLFWVEVAYKIYHKERIQKYKDAVNQSLDDPYLSSKIVAISSGISFLIICIAIFSTFDRNACIGFYLNIDDAYDLPIYEVSGISRGD